MTVEERLKSLLRDVPDFPRPGILFKDTTPLLAVPEARRMVIESIAQQYAHQRIDAVAGIEARGFIFGTLLAQHLNVPFVPVRKAGKLPFRTLSESYALEYGEATLEMHIDGVQPGWKVLIHDDLLATGGTAAAAGRLISRLRGDIAGFSFVINLGFLPGENNLKQAFGVNPSYLLSFN
ncbi:MAG: adenine phosphoribosyltransferase [Cyclobacteriaceae bacterium]